MTQLLRSVSIVSALLLGSGVCAQNAPSYDALVAEGLSEFDAGRWVEAYTLFLKAHGISPNARTLRGMGMTSYELSEYPRALAELQASLDSDNSPLTVEQRAHVEGLIARAARLVGTLEVTLDPPGAQLLVNHEVTETRLFTVRVGKVLLRARLNGYADEERVLTVGGGEHYRVALKLGSQSDSAAAPAVDPTPSMPAPQPVPQPEATTPPPRVAIGAREPDASTDGGAHVAPDPPRHDDASITSSPWLWVGIGAAIAGGIAAALLVGNAQDTPGEPLGDGNVGISVRALEAR